MLGHTPDLVGRTFQPAPRHQRGSSAPLALSVTPGCDASRSRARCGSSHRTGIHQPINNALAWARNSPALIREGHDPDRSPRKRSRDALQNRATRRRYQDTLQRGNDDHDLQRCATKTTIAIHCVHREPDSTRLTRDQVLILVAEEATAQPPTHQGSDLVVTDAFRIHSHRATLASQTWRRPDKEQTRTGVGPGDNQEARGISWPQRPMQRCEHVASGAMAFARGHQRLVAIGLRIVPWPGDVSAAGQQSPLSVTASPSSHSRG